MRGVEKRSEKTESSTEQTEQQREQLAVEESSAGRRWRLHFMGCSYSTTGLSLSGVLLRYTYFLNISVNTIIVKSIWMTYLHKCFIYEAQQLYPGNQPQAIRNTSYIKKITSQQQHTDITTKE
jgi:hypothetical protein